MALGLAEAGADLIVCGRRRAPLEDCAAQARALGADVAVVTADVTQEEDLARLRDEAGQVDILINNAGFGMQGKWTEVSLAEWRAVMALNLDAPFRLIQIFAPPMMARGWGRIINIASIYGSIGGDPRRYPGLDWDVASYFASKHGLHGITHYLAPRLAPYGVCINSLSPGMFPSEQNMDKLTPAVIHALIDGTPMQRLGQTDDLKGAVVYLSSPAAKFTTGQDLIVDGGWTVW
jgi:NAD(P)-dependent dehydrogenase (short-subunit alcohol dehydrogenase family)